MNDLATVAYWNPRWDNTRQMALALTAVNTGDRFVLPILADACEDAGCDSRVMLSRLRDPNIPIQAHAWLLGRLSKLGAAEVFNRYRPKDDGRSVTLQFPSHNVDIKPRGVFTWESLRPDGLIEDPVVFSNIACTAGLNYMLETMFRSGAQITTWYAGIIDATGYTGVSAGDTSASHTGWAEFTSYAAANRPTWSPAAAAGGIVVNTTTFSYTLTADMTAKGLFVISNNSKGGATGTLFATGLNDRSATNGTVLSATYTVTLTPS